MILHSTSLFKRAGSDNVIAACHRLVEDSIVKFDLRDHTPINSRTVVTMDPKVPNLLIGDVLIGGDRVTAMSNV